MATLDHCKYFVKRKKRYCRMTVKKGNEFCGEHQQYSVTSNFMQNDNNVFNKRIACPLDPTHTCYERKLSKHLTVCNAKKLFDLQPVYIVKGINISNEISEVPKHIPLSQLDNSIVDAVISKVDIAFEKLPELREAILEHDVLKCKIKELICGKPVKKHVLQNSSLVAHLEKADLLQDDTCFIEFGAGKGKLTYWLAQVIKDKKDSCVLLIDRSSHRHKSDNKLKNAQFQLSVKRLRADIADLHLNNVEDVRKYKNKVGIAKHLCGAATDLTIQCLANAIKSNPPCNVTGLVIAFCCHHRCEYIPYVGKKYLEQNGFTASDFPILCSIASWATCSAYLNIGCKAENNLSSTGYSRVESTTSRVQERELIGYKVKGLLNWGRLEFLKSIGFSGNLYRYISPDISLENTCIVACKQRTDNI